MNSSRQDHLPKLGCWEMSKQISNFGAQLSFRVEGHRRQSDSARQVSVVWARQVMRTKRIQTEIMIEVAPDSMDVIRIVLCIVVLDHECGPLNAIVVRLAGLTAAGPCEVDVLQSCSAQFRELLVS